MKKLCYFIICLVSSLLYGCPGPAPEYNLIYSEHYIMSYYTLQSIKIELGEYGDPLPNKAIMIRTNDSGLGKQTYVNKDVYELLCEKHRDMDFNNYLNDKTSNVDADFVSISIISDADFDAGHLRDSDLGDILMFHSSSPVKYIRSGYMDLYNISNTGIYSTSHPINKLVLDLGSDDLILLDPYSRFFLGNLEFLSTPTLSKVHNLTVKLTTDDGRTFEDTVQVSWE